MKIGVIPDSFRLPIRDAIRKAAQIAVEGIQPYTTTGDLSPSKLTRTGRQDFKQFVTGLGLEISALCGDFGGGFANPKTVDEQVAKEKTVIDLAAELKVRVVTTHIGVVPPEETALAWKTMDQSLRELGTYAADRGVVLATETGPEPAALLGRFLSSLNNPGLKVNYDPANLAMVQGDDPVKGVETLAAYIVHTHAKDGIKLAGPDEKGRRFREVPLGEGAVNFPEYLKALKHSGFDGFLTIEREVGEDPAADIIRARDFLRGLLQTMAL